MIFDFKGFNENVLTFPVNGTLTAGTPVVISEGAVSAAAANADILGVCTAVSDGVATVQVSGYVELPYTGTVSYGYIGIAANGSGGVKKYDSAVRKAYVIKIDSTNSKLGFIL